MSKLLRTTGYAGLIIAGLASATYALSAPEAHQNHRRGRGLVTGSVPRLPP